MRLGTHAVDALANIRRLLVQSNQNFTRVTVQAVFFGVEADVFADLSHDRFVVNLGGGGDFTENHDHVRLGRGFARDFRIWILGQDAIGNSPTREIALALYTGGFRPGLFANLLSKLPGPLATLVELDEVELMIKRDQPRVEATAKMVVAGNEQTLRLMGELASPSAMRLQETLVKAEVFGQTTDLQSPLRTKRSLFVTFLDDDMLVVRDETGVPDIWLRKNKEFMSQESAKVDSSLPETWTTKPEFKVDPSKDIEPGWVNELSEDIGPSDY